MKRVTSLKHAKQCELTKVWPTFVNDKMEKVIHPITSPRNRPNNLGIIHTSGKLAGKIKKTKAVKDV